VRILTLPGLNLSVTQDKTRQDKTRQDKTRQDKTRQDKTRQDKTKHMKPREVRVLSNKDGMFIVELVEDYEVKHTLVKTLESLSATINEWIYYKVI